MPKLSGSILGVCAIALSMGALAGPAPAAPSPGDNSASQRNPVACGPIGTTNRWVGFHVAGVTCAEAHTLARGWSSSCPRSTSPDHAIHCNLTGTVNHHPVHFDCGNIRGFHTPRHWRVHCKSSHHHNVYFAYYPHS